MRWLKDHVMNAEWEHTNWQSSKIFSELYIFKRHSSSVFYNGESRKITQTKKTPPTPSKDDTVRKSLKTDSDSDMGLSLTPRPRSQNGGAMSQGKDGGAHGNLQSWTKRVGTLDPLYHVYCNYPNARDCKDILGNALF